MITRRSFLIGAAGVAALSDLALRRAATDSVGPQHEPTPTLRSEIMAPLPSRVVAGYWTYWGSPMRLTDIPTHYNTVFLFHATPVGGAPGTTGAVEWNRPGDGRGAATHFAADLAEFRKTRTAILTVGGARANIDLSTRARAEAFLASIKRIHGELGGFDGLDWNNYEGEQEPHTDQMIWISQELKATYGQSFAITSPPAPWRPADVTHCRAMIDAGVMDMVSPQYYDGPGLGVQEHIVNSVDEWVDRMGDAGRVGIGFGLADAVNYSTLADVEGAWKTLSARHPTLRGAFNWDIPTDEGLGWPFAHHAGPLMRVGALAPPTSVPVIPIPPPFPRRAHAAMTEDAPAFTNPALPLGLTPAVPTPPSDARLPGPVVGTHWSTISRPRTNQRTAPPRIILSTVGSPHHHPALAATTGPDEFAADVIRVATAHGLDGFDWDLEHAPAFNTAELERASGTIITEMRRTRPAFSLTVTVRPGRGRDEGSHGRRRTHADFVRRCADIVDALQITYDSRDHRILDVEHLRAEVQAWLDGGLREDQIGLLWRSGPPGAAVSGSQLVTVDHAQQAWNTLTQTWPGLRGVGTSST